MLSIIIPVLNEAENLERLLPHLRVVCPGVEVIVVDGGSEDETSAVVRRFPHGRLFSNERGRARQMNAGTKVAKGQSLLFSSMLIRSCLPGLKRRSGGREQSRYRGWTLRHPI
ncbi:MAG: glycosyltransferase [Candidatus Methylomirabilis sp.]|nr:glycosyltransferase [Candidatus Methylomirabilis sp.]